MDAEVPSPQLSGLVEIINLLRPLPRPIRVHAQQQYQGWRQQASLENQLANTCPVDGVHLSCPKPA